LTSILSHLAHHLATPRQGAGSAGNRNPMKTRNSRKPDENVLLLTAKARAATRKAETARKRVRRAKARLKLARKAFKRTRKAARQARKAAKEILRALEAASPQTAPARGGRPKASRGKRGGLRRKAASGPRRKTPAAPKSARSVPRPAPRPRPRRAVVPAEGPELTPPDRQGTPELTETPVAAGPSN
jgi:hypothetical protein